MALNDILTSMEGARDALVTAINAKGGSLADSATLYQCADAVGSLSGGASAEYYKCASVTPSIPGAVIEVTGDTTYGCNGRYTIVDASATGKNRTWRTSDGVWEIKNNNAITGIDRWAIYEVASDTRKIDNLVSSVPDNPWEVTEWQNNTSPYAYPDLVLTPTDSARSWTGYKAVLGDSGYTISDTLTEGLVYSGMTPQVGSIYDSNAFVRVAQLYNSSAVEPVAPVFYAPLMTDNSVEINPGSTTLGITNVTFDTVEGIQTAVCNAGRLLIDKNNSWPNGNASISFSFGLRLTEEMANKLLLFYGSNDGSNGLGIQVNGTSLAMCTKEGNNRLGDYVQLYVDTWYHILLTYSSATGVWQLLVNGEVMASATKSLNISSSYNFNFGSYIWSGSWQDLYACITRCRIYDYVVDNPNNIKWLMQEIGIS